MDTNGDKPRDPIVRTKLNRPALSSMLLCRTRLLEQLGAGTESPLTLVSAPAGYGKSTLASLWAEGLEHPYVWVSLDQADSDPGVFLDYVVEAVRTVVPGALEETHSLLRGSSLPPLPVMTRTLINELDALDDAIVLILDDYHRLASSSKVHGLVAELLEHPPRDMRLVLVTRSDPPLPLSALRARGRLKEIRLQDLRFTDAEAIEFLAAAVDIAVSEDALANLQHEVEGWAVGLRLVSLALPYVADPESFLRDLRGGLPHTQEYLFREVLDWQPAKVRYSMLRTSILDRFCPELLDAVCAADDAHAPTILPGGEFVDLLQRGNLFVIALDSQGTWFRHHHLFQEVLQRTLREEVDPEEVARLHARAGGWFESQGLIEEAVRHTLAAGSPSGAAEIVERHAPTELNEDRWYVLERWWHMLPSAIRQERPELLFTEAWIAFSRLQLERIPPILERIEALFEGEGMDDVTSGNLSFLRGNQAYWEGQPEQSVPLLEEALRLLDGRRPHVESNAEILLGLSRSMSGQGEAAIRALEHRIQGFEKQEGQYFAHLIGALVFIHVLSGDLARARTEALRMHHVARRSELSTTSGWGAYFRGCIHLQLGELDQAVVQFGEAARLRYAIDSEAAFDALAGLALAEELRGRTDAADAAMERLGELAEELNHPLYLRVVESCRARVAVLRCQAPALQRVPAVTSAPTPAELFMWVEVPALTRVRVLIAAGTAECLAEAIDLLGTIHEVAASSRFTCQLIELTVLRVLALARQGHREEATKALVEAVNLAAPGGWVRPFLEAGPTMAAMLHELGGRLGHGAFRARLLEALGDRGATMPASSDPAGATGRGRADVRPLIETLTHRELDVLELLAKRLQNKEIAAQLYISTHTVNDHLKHIYQKFGVSGRRPAVRRAIELGLVDPRRSS